MQRTQLSDMTVFVEVARCGGFRAAAERLKLRPGSVSEAVQRFEDRLGVRLFERTTRRIALTSAGEKLYRRSLPAITDLESAVRELDDERDAVSGTLKLSAPRSSGALFLDDVIARYARRYPQVRVEVLYEDRKSDLVSSGIDAAIRSSTLLEQDTHAVAIGPVLQMAVVAAPGYLEERGVPETPGDLTAHDGICFAFADGAQLAPWNFEGPDGPYAVMPRPRMVVNEVAALLSFAAAGLGLTYLYAQSAAPLLAEGRLIPVLKGMASPLQRYSINYLSKRHMPARLRAFIDLAKQDAQKAA